MWLPEENLKVLTTFLNNLEELDDVDLREYPNVINKCAILENGEFNVIMSNFNYLILWLRYHQKLLQYKPDHAKLRNQIFDLQKSIQNGIKSHNINDEKYTHTRKNLQNDKNIKVTFQKIHEELIPIGYAIKWGSNISVRDRDYINLSERELLDLTENLNLAKKNMLTYKIYNINDPWNDNGQIVTDINRFIYRCKLLITLEDAWTEIETMAMTYINITKNKLIANVAQRDEFDNLYTYRVLTMPLDSRQVKSFIALIESEAPIIKRCIEELSYSSSKFLRNSRALVRPNKTSANDSLLKLKKTPRALDGVSENILDYLTSKSARFPDSLDSVVSKPRSLQSLDNSNRLTSEAPDITDLKRPYLPGNHTFYPPWSSESDESDLDAPQELRIFTTENVNTYPEANDFNPMETHGLHSVRDEDISKTQHRVPFGDDDLSTTDAPDLIDFSEPGDVREHMRSNRLAQPRHADDALAMRSSSTDGMNTVIDLTSMLNLGPNADGGRGNAFDALFLSKEPTDVRQDSSRQSVTSVIDHSQSGERFGVDVRAGDGVNQTGGVVKDALFRPAGKMFEVYRDLPRESSYTDSSYEEVAKLNATVNRPKKLRVHKTGVPTPRTLTRNNSFKESLNDAHLNTKHQEGVRRALNLNDGQSGVLRSPILTDPLKRVEDVSNPSLENKMSSMLSQVKDLINLGEKTIQETLDQENKKSVIKPVNAITDDKGLQDIQNKFMNSLNRAALTNRKHIVSEQRPDWSRDPGFDSQDDATLSDNRPVTHMRNFGRFGSSLHKARKSKPDVGYRVSSDDGRYGKTDTLKNEFISRERVTQTPGGNTATGMRYSSAPKFRFSDSPFQLSETLTEQGDVASKFAFGGVDEFRNAENSATGTNSNKPDESVTSTTVDDKAEDAGASFENVNDIEPEDDPDDVVNKLLQRYKNKDVGDDATELSVDDDTTTKSIDHTEELDGDEEFDGEELDGEQLDDEEFEASGGADTLDTDREEARDVLL